LNPRQSSGPELGGQTLVAGWRSERQVDLGRAFCEPVLVVRQEQRRFGEGQGVAGIGALEAAQLALDQLAIHPHRYRLEVGVRGLLAQGTLLRGHPGS
jgi:hypothetical protein